MMKILLIKTPCYELEDDRLESPLGLLYLATFVNNYGYQAQIADLASISPEFWIDHISYADIYGFSTYTATYRRTLDVLKVAKQVNPQAVTVAGGPHASALPSSVVRDFDYVVVGEGELAMLYLLRALDKGETIPHIIRKPPVESLDVLPFPDYSLVDIHSYHRLVNGEPSLSILSSRGCPYQCVFCNSIIMGGHHNIRFRSASNVVEEIRGLKAEWDISSFRFQDDIFTLNLPRLREMTALLQRERVTYRCFGRVDLCNQETAMLLYKGGCRHIAFGVESGSSMILKRMCKNQTVTDIYYGIMNAKAAGLMVRVYLIVGFPGETWDTVNETVKLMLACMPHEFVVYPLIPYPGTLLYEEPEKFGITAINHDFSQYFQVRRGRSTGFVFQTRDLDGALIADMRTHIIEQLEPAITWAGDSRGFK